MENEKQNKPFYSSHGEKINLGDLVFIEYNSSLPSNYIHDFAEYIGGRFGNEFKLFEDKYTNRYTNGKETQSNIINMPIAYNTNTNETIDNEMNGSYTEILSTFTISKVDENFFYEIYVDSWINIEEIDISHLEGGENTLEVLNSLTNLSTEQENYKNNTIALYNKYF